MAGHSKWAQIKRTKAVVDARRGAVFTRLGREISVAARAGADPAGNFQLRTAIARARAAGVPAANIERAIAKGAGMGADGGEAFEAVRYEGYGPAGVGVLVEALTDNRNRTAADLRLAFHKHGGNLGETGCVGYQFRECGIVTLAPPFPEEEALLEVLVSLDAEEYRQGENGLEVIGPPERLEALQDGLRQAGFAVRDWRQCWLPLTTVVPPAAAADSCRSLLAALEDLDDVRGVSSNLGPPPPTTPDAA
jgi:YebC/PmpR family DNA-binding regulatory protein